ncbi:MAG TPA: serine/threonine-protein kinase, partial [Kofleriaceae bacterium]
MSVPGKLGRYELITRIGQGGMAEVQLALQRGPAGFEKLVVVKLVHGELATQKAFVDMLLDEARVAALVKHPNVVDIYDLGVADGKYFIAMEYLEGEPLLSVLRAGREGKRLDALSTGRLIADTADGLDAAHELRNMAGERIELVHHDISLGNIVVLYNGQVKLVDFGVAKASQSATSAAPVQGKFGYMAPEKLKGSPGDRRSDIFSLGCVLWEALTLKRLFRGGNDAETMKQVLEHAVQPPSKVNSDVPVEYDEIVMRSLDRDPAKRQQTAKQFANELEELLRKSGYGAKNDRIGKYMQETFKDHIEARKKLVQEVVSKGSASAETVDAAFSEATQLANGSPRTPTMGDFSIMRPLSKLSGAPATVPKVIPPIVPRAFVPDAFSDQNRPTEISSSPFETQTDGGGATEIAPPPIDPDAPEL